MRVDPDAAAWIAERGGAVTLLLARRNGCCGGGAWALIAELGADAAAGLERLPGDGTAIFAAPPVVARLRGLPSPPTLRVCGFGPFRRLAVEDAPILPLAPLSEEPS